jgi:hypothetical protein
MRRFFLLVGVAVLISAWLAVPAFACIQSEPATCTPVNQDHGRSDDHAPDPTIKSHPSSNDNGVGQSDALIYDGSPVGSYCSPG